MRVRATCAIVRTRKISPAAQTPKNLDKALWARFAWVRGLSLKFGLQDLVILQSHAALLADSSRQR